SAISASRTGLGWAARRASSIIARQAYSARADTNITLPRFETGSTPHPPFQVYHFRHLYATRIRPSLLPSACREEQECPEPRSAVRGIWVGRGGSAAAADGGVVHHQAAGAAGSEAG